MLNILTDYCRWQDCVTADDLNVLRILQGKVVDDAAQNLDPRSLGFLVVPTRSNIVVCALICAVAIDDYLYVPACCLLSHPFESR